MASQQIVEFDAEEFLAIYDEFSGIASAKLQNFFNLATGILSPIVGNPVCGYDFLKSLLYLLTAHIAELYKKGFSQGGVLASASEGSVSASFSIPSNPNAQWFWKTGYGELYWEQTKRFRSGRYICGCGC